MRTYCFHQEPAVKSGFGSLGRAIAGRPLQAVG